MEERRKMHDPGHVRIVELDESRRTERFGHGEFASAGELASASGPKAGRQSGAHIGQQGHEPGPLDRLRNGMLAGRMAARLAAADDASVPIRELAQQIEVLVVDVHRPRLDAVDADRVLLGDLDRTTGLPFDEFIVLWL